MSFKIQKSHIYIVTLALCIFIPYFNNYEITFILWSLSSIVTVTMLYSKTIIKLMTCYLLIITIAIVVMLFYDYGLYYIIRDITYLLKPVMGLAIGYQLCKRCYSKIFEILVYIAFFIAIYHILTLFYAVIIHQARTVNDLRLFGGYFSDFEVYALIILIFHKKFELKISKNYLTAITVIVAISAFLYLARTNFIQFAILYLAMMGYYKINRNSMIVISTVAISALLFYTTILYINPKRNGEGIEALLYKIKIAPVEPFKTRINAEDYKDFNDNYRSYENIHTVRQITSKGYLAVLFGEGMGSRVDLKREVWLGDMMLRHISFLHNGFMTVLLKSGLTGILIYLYSIYLLLKTRPSTIPIVKNVSLLLTGTGIFMIFSSWVFMGLYNLLDSKSILIGLLICYQEIRSKQKIIVE